jgi:hypothetical protein
MNRVDDEFFTRSGLAAHRQCRVRGGHLADELIYMLHDRALSHDGYDIGNAVLFINSNLATGIRTSVVFVLAWAVALADVPAFTIAERSRSANRIKL